MEMEVEVPLYHTSGCRCLICTAAEALLAERDTLRAQVAELESVVAKKADLIERQSVRIRELKARPNPMTDIVERLRDEAEVDGLFKEAADEIERLRIENESLRYGQKILQDAHKRRVAELEGALEKCWGYAADYGSDEAQAAAEIARAALEKKP